MQSTLNLFQHLISTLPPFFPADVKTAMEKEFNRLHSTETTTVGDIEAVMIRFGYVVWPWRQAFLEFVRHNEQQLGEHFLLPKLPPHLQDRYKLYRNYGGSLTELTTGRPAQFFTLDERSDMTHALVAMEQELEQYTTRQIQSTSRAKYLEKVGEHSRVLDEIKQHVDALYAVANGEVDHPQLAAEIRERVRSFEHGLCLLGPEINHEEVRQALPFFHGRVHELNRMRGIHIPMRINFD